MTPNGENFIYALMVRSGRGVSTVKVPESHPTRVGDGVTNSPIPSLECGTFCLMGCSGLIVWNKDEGYDLSPQSR